MTPVTLVIIVLVLILLGGGVAAFVFFSSPSENRSEIRGLLASAASSSRRGTNALAERDDFDVEQIKKLSGSASAGKRKHKEDLETKLFKAGFFTNADKQAFKRIQIILPFISSPAVPAALFLIGVKSPLLISVGVILGIFIGLVAPLSYLDRIWQRRQEETMYYLPLVIEQISIGVSSSLDIGPCIAQILQMARERDSHNPVTEMFAHAEKLIRSGLNLEDALREVSEANGINEVKHAFMFLAQCSRHGGEVSRQLQELADAVMMQRQVQVEGRITSLPVKATGPLIMVFAGFFALLLAGLLVRLKDALGGMNS